MKKPTHVVFAAEHASPFLQVLGGAEPMQRTSLYRALYNSVIQKTPSGMSERTQEAYVRAVRQLAGSQIQNKTN